MQLLLWNLEIYFYFFLFNRCCCQAANRQDSRYSFIMIRIVDSHFLYKSKEIYEHVGFLFECVF